MSFNYYKTHECHPLFYGALMGTLLLCSLSLNAWQFSRDRNYLNTPVAFEAKQRTLYDVLLEKKHPSLWHRLIKGFQFKKTQHPEIEKQIKNFLKHKADVKFLSRQAQPYLYALLEELEARNMPTELALLPMIESRFSLQAKSHANAVGIWQINQITAKHLGLKRHKGSDPRLNFEAATQAALTYLDTLNKTFQGDWHLTLAAYNSGSGTVKKAIRKNQKARKATDFWSLDLPKETRQYVPKFLALTQVFAHHQHYGITLQPIFNLPHSQKM